MIKADIWGTLSQTTVLEHLQLNVPITPSYGDKGDFSFLNT